MTRKPCIFIHYYVHYATKRANLHSTALDFYWCFDIITLKEFYSKGWLYFSTKRPLMDLSLWMSSTTHLFWLDMYFLSKNEVISNTKKKNSYRSWLGKLCVCAVIRTFEEAKLSVKFYGALLEWIQRALWLICQNSYEKGPGCSRLAVDIAHNILFMLADRTIFTQPEEVKM